MRTTLRQDFFWFERNFEKPLLYRLWPTPYEFIYRVNQDQAPKADEYPENQKQQPSESIYRNSERTIHRMYPYFVVGVVVGQVIHNYTLR
ncbi:MAG TPA: hypothetical protein VGF01_00085 [Terracidiphilus sp.]